MSKKSTKIIAAAGVVAGLGVAALPALTFAESVAGQVQVKAIVDSAIAMTITGNDDASTSGPVNVYAPSGATEINSYGTDGGQAAGTAYDPLALQTSGSKTNILPNQAKTDDANFKSTIKIWTNANGYTITLKDGDTDTSLVSGTNSIPAVGTVSDNAIEAGSAAWGYKVGSTASTWLAVPASTASAASIKADGSAGADGETTEVYYAVSTAANQATGTYTDTIVYTATTNN
ncbi:hypothetical protein IKE07_01815 [Candidatus Saccharibacteria bacterium]|nr:hypothetical protein [Candidatus Saccharibacteria bacterium]